MDSFSKNSQISGFMKNCPLGDEFFHVDRWTDGGDNEANCFLQFCEGA
jgi:hypothetical protein